MSPFPPAPDARCERCHRDPASAGLDAATYAAAGRVRRVCVDCLSYAEKDALLTRTPRQERAAERDGRFERPGVAAAA